jgi:hypothetical protein
LTAFSQTVTTNLNDSCVIKLSCNIARQVAVDLVSYDSLKNEQSICEQRCELYEKSIQEYISINNSYESIVNEYSLLEKAYDAQEKKLIDQINGLSKQVVNQQNAIKFFRTGFIISTTALASGALVLYLK